MIAKTLLFLCSLLFASAFAQPLREFRMYDDVRITIDVGRDFDAKKKSIIILYALPAGNTTEHTMGKKMKEGDDWHYDIQHIKAQTVFIRQEIKNRNIVVAYLDNTYKSWVLWKTKHKDYVAEVQHIVDTLFSLVSSRQKVLYLNGHSAGGRFIFSYL